MRTPAVILYGRNPVREALRGRRAVRRVWATEAAAREWWLKPTREHTVAGAGEIEALCGSPDHQGVCAEAERYPYADPDALLEPDDALVVCLDEVTDPHNLGAVARVAESAGASGLVIPQRRSAEVTPAACKASAGALEHLPVAMVRNLADWLGEAKDAKAWVYGAAAEGETVPYDRPDYSGTRGAGAGLGGPRPAPAGGGGLRPAGLAAPARARGVAQRLHRRGGPAVRDLAAAQIRGLTGIHNLVHTRAIIKLESSLTVRLQVSAAPGEVARH